MKQWEIFNDKIGKFEKWKIICGVCLNIMDIKEIMQYSLYLKTYHPSIFDEGDFYDYPIPHLNSSHICNNCGSCWELIENLGIEQTFVCSRNFNEIYLIGNPRKI